MLLGSSVLNVFMDIYLGTQKKVPLIPSNKQRLDSKEIQRQVVVLG
jgi:hypothetical protein